MADWALAGAGWISGVHGTGLAAVPGARVVAVGSHRQTSAQALAGRIGGRAVELGELPAGADIVVVGTPPARHAEDALRALAGGAAVLVETPICHRLDHADRLVRVAEAGGVVVYAENLLFADVTGAALTEVAGLGPLRHLSARAVQPAPSHRPGGDPDWGGGAVLDLGVHALALVVRAARESPVEVAARFTATTATGVESRAEIELGFLSGLRAGIEVEWRPGDPVCDLQAAADDGVVRLEIRPEPGVERDGEPVAVTAAGSDGELPPEITRLGYLDELTATEAAWRAGRSSTVSDAAFGREVLELVCAASVSARLGGQAVGLPFLGPRDRTPAELWTDDAVGGGS